MAFCVSVKLATFVGVMIFVVCLLATIMFPFQDKKKPNELKNPHLFQNLLGVCQLLSYFFKSYLRHSQMQSCDAARQCRQPRKMPTRYDYKSQDKRYFWAFTAPSRNGNLTPTFPHEERAFYITGLSQRWAFK